MVVRLFVLPCVLATLVCGYFTLPARAADWKEPADKKITEDQVKVYLATQNDWLDETYKTAQAVDDAKTQAGRISAVANVDQRLAAVLDKHHISQAEFNWVGSRVIEAWGISVYVYDTQTKLEADIASRVKENDQKEADARKRLADYQAAQKDGHRVMSKDDRDAAIKSATSDQQAAIEESRQHADEAKAAADEVSKHDTEAKAADTLAATPPADVSADDRQGYIDGKKSEAQGARDAAKEARDRLAEANKAKAEADAKAAVAAGRIAHPEIPVSDDEKAAVKAENDAAVTQAQSDIDSGMQNKTQMALMEAQMKKSVDEVTRDVPKENIDLMHKYSAQYQEMFQRQSRGGASTQPAKS